jgi:hypothetical protein
MQLRLKRSQRSSMMGKTIFTLDARAELSRDEQALVSKFGLGKLAVYDSEARKKHGDAAFGHFDDAGATPVIGATAGSAGRGLLSNARGLARAAMAALSLRVTVDSLSTGQHIECKDLDELLGSRSSDRQRLQEHKSLSRSRADIRRPGGGS